MASDELAKQIDELTERLETLKQTAFPHLARERISKGICLSCGGSLGEPGTRGCHANCYRTIKRDIDAGRYSEGAAIAHGLLSPEQKGGRKAEATGGRASLLATKRLEADRLTAEVEAEFARDIELSLAREQAAEFKAGSKKRATKKKAE